ncbi:hypothetical protein TL16_g09768 [Triparma laevis f. inornata]|uniref:Uncharacterized protein n=1 Tax=Triparma laevis f. inornata TaxID=1714386 RepID=A0A9W7B8E7_9STRA|nr:hypothetical protein TL16_g09768 [Triparma laevis f. inornata]
MLPPHRAHVYTTSNCNSIVTGINKPNLLKVKSCENSYFTSLLRIDLGACFELKCKTTTGKQHPTRRALTTTVRSLKCISLSHSAEPLVALRV